MRALRQHGFLRLWIAGLISDTGDWLLLVSLPILVYQYTGSALGTAGAFLVELLPPALLAPIAGQVADRLDRRNTLVAVTLVQAAMLTPLLVVNGRAGLPLLYGVLAAQAALAAVFDPTKSALLPTLVEPDLLVSANSLVSLNENVGRLIGGSLGGLLLTVGGGLSTIATADGASFLIAAALIATLAPAKALQRSTAPTSGAAPVAAEWRAALSPRAVRGGLLVLLTASVAQGIFVVLFVVFVAQSLHGGAAEIGLLRGVQAVGAIGAGLLLAAVGRVPVGKLTACAAAAFGLLDLAIWNAPHLTVDEPVYIALFIAVGAPGILLMTGLGTAMQGAAAEGRRGKVFAAMGVATSFGQATGIVIAGVLGDPLGVLTILNAQGVLYLIAGVLAARWMIVTRTQRPASRSQRSAAGADAVPLGPA